MLTQNLQHYVKHLLVYFFLLPTRVVKLHFLSLSTMKMMVIITVMITDVIFGAQDE